MLVTMVTTSAGPGRGHKGPGTSSGGEGRQSSEQDAVVCCFSILSRAGQPTEAVSAPAGREGSC